MASFCRSALMAGSRSVARSRALTQTSLNSLNPAAMASPFASATRTVPCATRFVSVLGFMESVMPLHSAIASARLTSNIAVDSTCWSSLSLEAAVPRWQGLHAPVISSFQPNWLAYWFLHPLFFSLSHCFLAIALWFLDRS